jgi:hypothetical protein
MTASANTSPDGLSLEAEPAPAIPLAAASASPDGFGYTYQDDAETPFGPTFSFINISSTGTILSFPTHNSTANITGLDLAGFDFEFYGISLTGLRVGNDGAVLVNPSAGADISFSNACPLTDNDFDDHSYMIAPWWDNWGDTGEVYWQLTGTFPNRSLIIQWDGMEHAVLVGDSVTFQLILFETSNLILFQYADTDAGNPNVSNGSSGTIGILGNNINNLLQYESCNGGPLQSGRAIRFQRSSITIVKDANPFDDSQAFQFSGSAGISSTFFLDDNTDPTFPVSRTFFVVPNNYAITETLPANWDLTNLSCVGGASVITAGATANITLAPDENVTCTFENSRRGSITIVKNAIPDDSQDFAFTHNITTPFSFDLDDDGPTGSALSNTIVFTDLLPATYVVTETLLADWDLTDITCTGAAIPPSQGVNNVSIQLGAGEDITCTFENTKRGTITIIKDATPDHPQGFDFTDDIRAPFGFTLDDDGPAGSAVSNTRSFTQVRPATYVVTETPAAGWNLTGIPCTGGTTTPNLGAGNVSIQLGPGQVITCTFTNQAQPASITIVKDAIPDDSQVFDFTDDIRAPFGFMLDDDGPGGSALSNTTTISNIVVFGTYAITESLIPGWDLTDISCTGVFTEDLVAGSVSVELNPGDDITCAFENSRRGSITIVKNAIPYDSQDFAFTSNLLGGFSLDDDGGQGNPISNTIVFADLLPATYVVTETLLSNWDLTNLSCTGPATTNPGTGRVSIQLDPGEDITCTFENTKRGTVTIIKDATPDHGQDFGFSGDLGGFTLDDDGPAGSAVSNTRSFTQVRPATYVVTETLVTGWDLTGIPCTGGTTTPNLGAGNVSIQLGPGQVITCTFTNEAQPASITIVKDAVPDGQRVFTFTHNITAPFNFTLDDDGPGGSALSNTTTISNIVVFGTYAITETAVPGWDLTDIDCGTETPVAEDTDSVSIQLDPGDDIICTFENSKRGSITIVKDAIPNDGQDFDFTSNLLGSFSLDDDGPAGSALSNTIVFTDLLPATYVVTETLLSNWDLTDIDCGIETPLAEDTDSVSIQLDPGEDITCTFENTKRGTIRVVKDAVPNNAQNFSFTITGAASFTLNDDGTPPNFQDFVRPAGLYTVTEGTATGWDLTGLSCVEDNTNNSSENIGARMANIVLEAGELVTCVFTNTAQPASITIIKDAVPNDGQDFGFVRNFGGNFFLDDDGTSTPLSNTITFSNLGPGAYQVSELATPGWTLGNLTCQDPIGNDTTTAGSTANIALAPGEDVICTFTNTATNSSITIIKNATPTSSQPFTFTGTLGSFTLVNDGVSPNFRTFFVPAGTYVVSETAVSGWNLTGLSCVDLTGGTTTNQGTGVATIGLASGENVTCTFSNQAVSAGGDIFLPIIFREGGPPPCTDIDLRVSNISIAGGVVTVQIQNTGSCPTDGGFWVDLYANIQGQQPNSLVGITADRRWNSPLVKANHGLFWGVSGLGAGASLTLTSDGSVGPPPDDDADNNGVKEWPPPAGATIMAYVDSFDSNDPNNATFVEIPETNESNNQSANVIFSATLQSGSMAESNPAADEPRPDLK